MFGKNSQNPASSANTLKQGQCHSKPTSDSTVGDTDISFIFPNNTVGDIKAQTLILTVRDLTGIEGYKNIFDMFLIDSGAIIFDFNRDSRFIQLIQSDFNTTVGTDGFETVLYEVQITCLISVISATM
jgi:hypothetical protein